MKKNLKLILLFVQRALQLLNIRLIFRKPLLLIRVTWLSLKLLFTKRDKYFIWDANISFTNKCNLNCEHCFAKKFSSGTLGGENAPELNTEEVTAAIQEQLKLGVLNFNLQGGEVFLRKDLEQVIKACKPYKSWVNIITNGTLITIEKLIEVKSWGVDQIVISIDSGIPEEHNSFRGKSDVWEKAIEAIELAKKTGLKVHINTTVTHKSLYSEGFNKIVEFCKEKKLMHWIFIAIPVGNWQGSEDVLIDKDDREYLIELNKKTNNMLRRDLSPHLFRTGCPALKEGVYLTPYGDILPCPFVHISLGNIRKYKTKDIVKRAFTIKDLTEKNELCLIGEDKEFIKKYGYQTFNSPSIPLDGEKLFNLPTIPERETPLGE